MTTSPEPFAPWTKPDAKDQEFQDSLDQASPEQFEGFVRELLKIAPAAAAGEGVSLPGEPVEEPVPFALSA